MAENVLNPFELTIKMELDKRASEDELFAKSYAKEYKNIKECCKYIYQEVQKQRSGENCVACESEYIFGLAMHYYDEDSIKLEQPKAQTKVQVSATPKPKAEPKNKTIPFEPKETKKPTDGQLSLF